MTSEITKKIFKNIHQIGIVTKNINQTIRAYCDYGIGPWNLWDFGPEMVEDMRVKGKRVDYRMTVATCKKFNVDFEIIEPKDDISIYYDFLIERGEGIQHFNYDSLDYESTLGFFKSKGLKITQFGNLLGKHRYVYFDTEKDTGHVIETSGNLPGLKRRKPNEIFSIGKGESGIGIKNIKQIGILVDDISKKIQKLSDVYKIGPWKIYDIKSEEINFTGKSTGSPFKLKVAVCVLQGVELILLQPVDTESIIPSFLKKRQKGPFLVSFEIDDYEKSLKFADQRGLEIIGDGEWSGRRFSILDSFKDLKFIACIISSYTKNKNQEPDGIYPE